jgi:hypothetical protein
VDTYSFNPSGRWELGVNLSSSDGSIWSEPGSGVFPQFAINATAIPEPADLSLMGAGFLVLLLPGKAVACRKCSKSR